MSDPAVPEPAVPAVVAGGPSAPGALPTADEAAALLADRPLAFYNALLTEHFVLQSVRAVTVSESTGRASLYLMTLSSSLVAFGFLARTPAALPFLGVVIPVVVVTGLFTYERLVQTSLEDIAALQAMQRIRRFYGGLLPGAAAFFPAPPERRAVNEMIDIGARASWRGVLFTVSASVAVVNSMVAGAGIALVLVARDVPQDAAVTVAVVCTAAFLVLHGLYEVRRINALVLTRRERP